MKAERYMFLSMLLSFTIIVTVVFFTIELGIQKTVYNNKITELKLENTKQKYEIKRLEDNHEETKEFAFLQRIVFCYEPIRHSIDTLEGKMRFSDGDYLIKNQTGECYVCKKEIFEETYKLLED